MITLKTPVYGDIALPDGLTDLDSFLRWRHSDGVPEKLKAHYLRGRVWVDLHMEELFSHNQVKTALGLTLAGIISSEDLGLYIPDGMLLRNDAADLATEPDVMFVSHESLTSGTVRTAAGKTRGAVATVLVGTPDMVAEIVSPSSEDSDSEWLMSAYHDAGVPEYWLIDARSAALRFDIFSRGAKGYTATRKSAGWAKSKVFARSFRLTRTEGKRGVPVYALAVR
jgi:Uma2 family endonuclease